MNVIIRVFILFIVEFFKFIDILEKVFHLEILYNLVLFIFQIWHIIKYSYLNLVQHNLTIWVSVILISSCIVLVCRILIINFLIFKWFIASDIHVIRSVIIIMSYRDMGRINISQVLLCLRGLSLYFFSFLVF